MDAESKSIEVKAANVEAAIAEGLARLGVSSDQVHIKVLDEGSRGLLGLGAREAKVCLTLLPPPTVELETPAPPEEPAQPVEPETPTQLAELEPEPTESRAEPLPTKTRLPTPTIACEILSELLHLMGVRAQVHVRKDQDTPSGEDAPPFVLDIEGDDLGILIGRRGQTLHDLQFVTRLIVSREVGEWVRLVVDVEKYKVRREKSLQQLANRLAERVVLTQQPIALEPMPPHERRVIHVTLRDHPIVTTESVGQGERRKVTIIPRN
jgi:spoIIIJ-associated protein